MITSMNSSPENYLIIRYFFMGQIVLFAKKIRRNLDDFKRYYNFISINSINQLQINTMCHLA